MKVDRYYFGDVPALVAALDAAGRVDGIGLLADRENLCLVVLSKHGAEAVASMAEANIVPLSSVLRTDAVDDEDILYKPLPTGEEFNDGTWVPAWSSWV